MLIIIEGIKSSGKTTLSKEVSKSLAISEYIKQPDLLDELGGNFDNFDLINFGVNKTILEITKKFNFDLILDEGFLTDLVQTSFIRHKDISLKLKSYNERLINLNYIIIFLVINKETLKKRLLEKNNRVTEGYLNELIIFQNYFQEFSKRYEKVYYFDSRLSIKEMIGQIKNIYY